MNDDIELGKAVLEFYASLGNQARAAHLECVQKNVYCDDTCRDEWRIIYVTLSNLQSDLKQLLEKHGVIGVIQVKVGGANNAQENKSDTNATQIQVGGSDNKQVIK